MSRPTEREWEGAWYRARQPIAVAVIAVAIATRLWLLLAFEAQGSDLEHFHALAIKGVDQGKAPYREFEVEYPPLAWWLIESPRLLDPKSYPNNSTSRKMALRRNRQFFRWYAGWFRFEMLLADCVCLVLTFMIGRRLSPAVYSALPASYVLITTAQPHLLYDRLDVALLMFFLLHIACWLRSLDCRPRANLWAVASYGFLGLGISFKIIPVIFVPYLLLADLWAAGSVWRFLSRVLALAHTAVVPFLVYAPTAGRSVLRLFQYHAERTASTLTRCGAASCSLDRSLGCFACRGRPTILGSSLETGAGY